MVTANASVFDTTSAAGPALDSNAIRLKHPVFDSATNRIHIAWTLSNPGNNKLEIGVSYSTSGYPLSPPPAIQVVPVGALSDSTLVQLHEPLVFNATYYIALWERKVDGSWTAPTPRSEDTVTTTGFNWQPVTYFTQVGGDTAFAFNYTVRLITDSVTVDNVASIKDTLRIVNQLPPALMTGFVPVSPAFRFSQPQQSPRFYVGLKCSVPAGYNTADIRIYRLQDSVWTVENGVSFDAATGYVYVKTNNLAAAFIAMIDTDTPTVAETHIRVVAPDSDLADTFYVSDNCANVSWQFLVARGGDAFDVIGTKLGSLGFTRSGQVIVQIPGSYVTAVNGVRARFVVTDGVHTTVKDVSRQVRRINSDYVLTSPTTWQPLRVTSLLDSLQIANALRGDTTWQYDKKQIRMFKWLPYAANSQSPNKWVEYSPATAGAFTATPGNAIWIKTRAQTTVNFGNGTTLPLDSCYSGITALGDGNFTDFALPYRFNMSVGDIIDSSALGAPDAANLLFFSWTKNSANILITTPLYNGGTAGAGATVGAKSTTLNCLDLTCYSVLNGSHSPIQLRVPAIPQSMSQYSQSLTKKKTTGGWALKVSASTATGSLLYIGYFGYDPSLGTGIRYYPSGPTFANAYAGIYDPEQNKLWGTAVTGAHSLGGCAFQIAFVNDSSGTQRLTCSFEPQGDFPASFAPCVYDPQSARFEPASPAIDVGPGATQVRWVFVGDKGYLAKAAVLYGGVLRLVGAYPNPFASAVHIRYSLPPQRAGAAIFTICDLRGRVVWQRVVSEAQMHGTGEIVWNARMQNGQRAAAGVYVLRMNGR